MERNQVQKGFLDTALRITAIAAMIIVTLCVASFGLSKLRTVDQKLANGTGVPEFSYGASQIPAAGNTRTLGVPPGRPAGPDPLAEHLDRLGKRLEELANTVSRERATQSEIARLADTMQAARQQADLSDTKLQQELGNLRVTSEVELRDLNRQIDSVAEKSQRLEREVVEQRTGILSALETQRNTIASQVARLEGGLDDVHSELLELRTKSQSALAFSQAARLRSAGRLKSLSPVPSNHSMDPAKSDGHDATWKEPVVLDSSASLETSKSASQRSVQTATSTGWKVSPMSHSVPGLSTQITMPELSLPPAPPAERIPASLPPIPDTSRRTRSGMIRAPLKSTLAPSASARPNRVPEIVELPSPDEPVVTQISATSPTVAGCPAREFEVQSTVIHIAATRPVDVEPAGVRMLNPELSTTAYGQPWSHDAVTHELLRKISLRTDATITGRQQTTISSDGTERLSIGSSCPHCNEVHGFEAGDRLILKPGPACDDVQRFHVVSEVAGGGYELDSLPEFDLTPMTNQTYVIAEKSVEGTIEESVATSDEKLVPIHGVLTPVSGPTKTRVSTQLMQRVVVMTFRNMNATPAEHKVAMPTTIKTIRPPAPLTLPGPAKQVAIKKLTPVRRHPVFMPPPTPATAFESPRFDSNVEFVAAALNNSSPGIKRAGHQQTDGYCEVCEKKHRQADSLVVAPEKLDKKEGDKSFLDWFRQVRSESTDSDSKVQNADFKVSDDKPGRTRATSESHKSRRRYVTKPGNRRGVR
jgi:hypothetical protein